MFSVMTDLSKNCVLILLIVSCYFSVCCTDELEHKPDFEFESDGNKSGPGVPLLLTPLIEKGNVSEARRRAAVKPLLNNVESYAGYLTVNKKFNSNLFFWFFKADDKNWENLPVAVWLQGGPSSSSLIGLFIENGPYVMTDGKLRDRFYSWHKKCNVIYIDNPVGSGFSFTDSDDGFARNQSVIGKQLLSAIKQFYILFPNLYKNEFFISGESYAGKYIPSFAYAIYKNNALFTANTPPTNIDDKVFINLKGLFIGNGLVDPANMLKYGDYFYQLGLIDSNTLKLFHDYEKEIVQAINSKDWANATELFSKMVFHYIYHPQQTLFFNVTGINQHFNYIANPSLWNSQLDNLIKSVSFRQSIHVGDKPFTFNGGKVAMALKDDVMKSVIDEVVELLNHYRIVFYNGQLDIICPYPMAVNFIENMKWSSAHEYANAERYVWRVNDDIAGYYKTAGNLTEVLVRNAGHLVPTDQPLWAYVLFNNFIYGKDFNDVVQ